MRTALAATLVFVVSLACGQSSAEQSPQTARQALIEMFFGEAPNHLEKHLPDETRHSLARFSSPGGDNYISELSMLAAQIRREGTKLELFDTGPTLLTAADPQPGTGSEPDKVEITVERDDLVGDEDQIELALHLSRGGKEVALPVIPRLTLSMQSEKDVWKLHEILLALRVPLTDPNFLKSIEDQQRSRSETRAMWSVQQVNAAEKEFYKSQGRFACSLAVLGKPVGEGENAVTYLYDPQLAQGKENGYVFAITGCDANHYKIAGEPAVADTGLSAFCSDESAEIRSAPDGKATTCLWSGEAMQKTPPERATGAAVVASAPAPGVAEQVSAGTGNGGTTVAGSTPGQETAATKPAAPTRVRVSQGVMQGLRISEVPPTYPKGAASARVRGDVTLGAIIAKDGTVRSLRVLTTASPILNQAAIEAVRQWRYKPYLLNGQPVEVDTTITVHFDFAH